MEEKDDIICWWSGGVTSAVTGKEYLVFGLGKILSTQNC